MTYRAGFLDRFWAKVDVRGPRAAPDLEGSRVISDPYTMQRRLCDDEGTVSLAPVDPPNLLAPGLTYLGQINNLRAHGGHPPVDKPFACTGSAHLAGEHIRCISPAHGLVTYGV